MLQKRVYKGPSTDSFSFSAKMNMFMLLGLFSMTAAQFGGGFNDGYGPGRLGQGGPGGPGGYPGSGVGNGDGQLTYEAKGRLICGLTGVDKVSIV